MIAPLDNSENTRSQVASAVPGISKPEPNPRAGELLIFISERSYSHVSAVLANQPAIISRDRDMETKKTYEINSVALADRPQTTAARILVVLIGVLPVCG